MIRLADLAADELTPEQERVRTAIATGPRGGVRGPFPSLLRRPELAERVMLLGDVIRYGTSLPSRLLELAVLVTARTMRCDYEWHAHSAIATEVGLTPVVVAAIRVGAEPPFTQEDERVVHDFVRELGERHDVSDPTYRAATKLFGALGVVDLAALVGYYAMVATTINAHRVSFPGDVPPAFDADPAQPDEET